MVASDADLLGLVHVEIVRRALAERRLPGAARLVEVAHGDADVVDAVYLHVSLTVVVGGIGVAVPAGIRARHAREPLPHQARVGALLARHRGRRGADRRGTAETPGRGAEARRSPLA